MTTRPTTRANGNGAMLVCMYEAHNNQPSG